ncbi:hypothetical protein EON83_25840 [bacterium]|nr:MAG: hypothetical protein EON83_25840 [bacterium]
MPRPTYPTLNELVAAFAESGLAECLPSDMGDSLEQAKGEFEKGADYGPFLWSGESEERSFDAPGPIRGMHGMGRCGGGIRLALHTGLLDIERLTVDGVEMTRGRDFFLYPADAGQDENPFTSIQFVRPTFSAQQGVKVTGDWGFCRELPDIVWRAVLLRAAWNERDTIARKYRALGMAAQNATIKIKESGPVKLEYATPGTASIEGALDLSATFNTWLDTWNRALRGRTLTQP